MEVSITKFRREMLDLVDRTMNGAEVWIVHNGRRFKIVPENPPRSRLSRITPLELKKSLREEMEQAWQDDWSAL